MDVMDAMAPSCGHTEDLRVVVPEAAESRPGRGPGRHAAEGGDCGPRLRQGVRTGALWVMMSLTTTNKLSFFFFVIRTDDLT